MKKLLVFVFLLTIAASYAKATVATENNTLIGQWKYEVPTAAPGFEAGTFIFNEKEGKLVGEVKLTDGTKIELKDISYAEGILKCGLYIDYEYISLDAKLDGKLLNGEVDTPQGKLKITAKKEE